MGITSCILNLRSTMKTLILENDPPDLVDKYALRIAEAKFPQYEVWAWFGRTMREDREGSIARLMALSSGDNLIMRHVFAYGFRQMEGMLLILEALSAKGVCINVWMVGSVSDELIKYLKHGYQSELDDLEKSKMDLRLVNALSDHRIMECWDSGLWEDRWESRQTRVTMEHLNAIIEKEKAECKHYSREVKEGKMFCSSCDIELPERPAFRAERNTKKPKKKKS